MSAASPPVAAAAARHAVVETLARLYVQCLTVGERSVLPDDEIGRVLEQMRLVGYGGAPGPAGVAP